MNCPKCNQWPNETWDQGFTARALEENRTLKAEFKRAEDERIEWVRRGERAEELCEQLKADLDREREANAKLKAEVERLTTAFQVTTVDLTIAERELASQRAENERYREAVGNLVEKILGLCGEDSRALVLEAKSAVLRFQALQSAAKQDEGNG